MGQENAANQAGEKRGISGSTLKLIALVTMLIDHIGAVVVIRMIYENAAKLGMVGMVPYDNLYVTYNALRDIGRFAFPIYCFLLVEGFQRTRSKTKYALRLGVFALVSEIPFDLALSSSVLEFEYQNVFFTLLFGLVTMIAVDAVERIAWNNVDQTARRLLNILQWLMGFGIVAVGAAVAELCNTDYGAKGVLCIMVLYLFRKVKVLQMIAGAVSFLWDGVAPLAFIPMAFYNGRRGMKLKYVFYLFYPVHLLILYLICVGLGISGIPAV